MQNKLVAGNKPELNFIQVRNGEASATIPVGTPAVYKMDGTNDGLDVVLPSSSTAAKATSFFAGVVVENDIGQALPKAGFAVNFGVVQAKIMRASRAASSDTWATAASMDLGQRMIINTGGNCFQSSDAGAQSVANPMVALAQTIATRATQASTYGGSGLYDTVLAKVFIRNL